MLEYEADILGFGEKDVLTYAAQELKKYALAVFGQELDVALKLQEDISTKDDYYVISVRNGCGYISGVNGRSVLMGVYGLFFAMGCRWIRPAAGGDYIVKKDISDCTAEITFKPKYRHRGLCSEGAISEENLIDMIEWLPKMGMNTVFLQFTDGHLFFEKWYKHFGSNVLKSEEYSARESKRHYENVVREIKRRGLCFHAVGHGWTTEPLGYVTYGDRRSEEKDIKKEHRQLFAEVDGHRGFFRAPGDTHLCYSNPSCREIMTDAVTEYLKKHKEIDALHFWLADNLNNHCECANCQKALPSDFYVKMLNELDEKLTKNHIRTKIVFLIYCDLLFPPKTERIKNPDRFIMMYAPIARDYFGGLYAGGFTGTTKPNLTYVRNKNRHPRSNEEYLYYLQNWQKTISCDSFAFEYHLMIFQYGKELSSLKISETLYEDMSHLCDVGLNGNVSCQLQRISLPTFLPNYVMAKCLSGTTQSFEAIVDEYMAASFGENKELVMAFLQKTKEFYCYFKGHIGMRIFAELREIEAYLQCVGNFLKSRFVPVECEAQTLSMKILRYFAEITEKFLLALYKKGCYENYLEEKAALFQFLDENEAEYQKYLDVLFFKNCVNEFLGETEVIL